MVHIALSGGQKEKFLSQRYNRLQGVDSCHERHLTIVEQENPDDTQLRNNCYKYRTLMDVLLDILVTYRRHRYFILMDIFITLFYFYKTNYKR